MKEVDIDAICSRSCIRSRSEAPADGILPLSSKSYEFAEQPSPPKHGARRCRLQSFDFALQADRYAKLLGRPTEATAELSEQSLAKAEELRKRRRSSITQLAEEAAAERHHRLLEVAILKSVSTTSLGADSGSTVATPRDRFGAHGSAKSVVRCDSDISNAGSEGSTVRMSGAPSPSIFALLEDSSEFKETAMGLAEEGAADTEPEDATASQCSDTPPHRQSESPQLPSQGSQGDAKVPLWLRRVVASKMPKGFHLSDDMVHKLQARLATEAQH